MRKLLKTILLGTLLTGTATAGLCQTPLQPQETCIKHEELLQFPNSSLEEKIPLCRQAYLSVYDPAARVPYYTSYFSTSKTATGCQARSNQFEADLALPEDSRVLPKDYLGSGFDRGHSVPDGDLSYNEEAELDSFLMSNVTPQTPSFNRGVWKSLEVSIRDWAVSGRNLQVISGPIYSKDSKRLPSGIAIPDAFYKIIIDLDSREYLSFYFKHEVSTTGPFKKYQVSLIALEKELNLKFKTSLVVSKKYQIWASSKSSIAVKKNVCNLQ